MFVNFFLVYKYVLYYLRRVLKRKFFVFLFRWLNVIKRMSGNGGLI